MTETRHEKPQSQSVSKCADLRQECRDAMFGKMDELHTEQMNELGDIKTDVAFMKGKAANAPVINSKPKNGK